MTAKYLFIFFVILFGFTSCGKIVDPENLENLGLTVYKISISDDNYARIVSSSYSSLRITAKLSVEGKEFNIHMKYQGASTRGMLKKSFKLFYEDSSDPVFNSQEIILNAQATDLSALRTLTAQDIFTSALPNTTFSVKPVMVEINDENQGLFVLIECVNEEFFHKRNIRLNELYKAINGKAQLSVKDKNWAGEGFEKILPDDGNFNNLEDLLYSLDGNQVANSGIKLDTLNYLKYMAASDFTCNWDGIIHNYYLAQTGPTDKYEIIPWDLDRSFNFFGFSDDVENSPVENILFNNLMSKLVYKNEYYKILNELLSKYPDEKIDQFIAEKKESIRQAYRNDRWLQSAGYDLDNEAENLVQFLKSRRNYLIKKMSEEK